MKTYRDSEVRRFIEVERICNKCGKKIDVSNPIADKTVTEISVNFGYGSAFDTQIWRFDLCDNCMVEITRGFRLSPDVSYGTF